MADTTWEEAKRCPKCGNPGDDQKQVSLPRGRGSIHYIYCTTQLCPWYGTCWMVQTRPDGTIPNRLEQLGPPDYRPMSADQLAVGQRLVEDAVKKDLRDT